MIKLKKIIILLFRKRVNLFMKKVDFKNQFKDLYLPKQIISEVYVPKMVFIGIDGKGLPSSEEFQKAIKALYSYAFTIKMSKMNNTKPEGYYEYTIPPLEAIWGDDKIEFNYNDKNTWIWTLMIRQPEFVTQNIFEKTKEILRKKKPELNVDNVRYFEFEEGLSAQIMHIGKYSEEHESISKIEKYIIDNNYVINGKHHEIYISDPRKTKPEKLKTVLRIPIK